MLGSHIYVHTHKKTQLLDFENSLGYIIKTLSQKMKTKDYVSIDKYSPRLVKILSTNI